MIKFLFGIILFQEVVSAAVLFKPSIRWADFAFQPVDREDTINYYGYGGELGVGYTWTDSFDTAIVLQYQPGKRETAGFLSPHATAQFAGPEFGFRFYKIMVLGLRVGIQKYQLNTKKFDSEIDGTWTGPAGGFSLGFVASAEKDNFWQIAIDAMEGVLINSADDSQGSRRLDSFGISATFVYNDQHGHGGRHDGLFDQLKF